MAFDITLNGCTLSYVAKCERGDGPPRFFGQAHASDANAWRSAQVYFTVDEDRRSARLHLHGTWKEAGTRYDNWYAQLEPRHS